MASLCESEVAPVTWLLVGVNDHAAVDQTGEGRAMNRHDYSMAEIHDALGRQTVRRILELVRLRAGHPAFRGQLEVSTPDSTSLRLRWSNGTDVCTADIDVSTGHLRITG